MVLVDEVLSPDSSRFWPASSYEVGREQESFDKQYLRNWLTSHGLKGKDGVEIPEEVVARTRGRYDEISQVLRYVLDFILPHVVSRSPTRTVGFGSSFTCLNEPRVRRTNKFPLSADESVEVVSKTSVCAEVTASGHEVADGVRIWVPYKLRQATSRTGECRDRWSVTVRTPSDLVACPPSTFNLQAGCA